MGADIYKFKAIDKPLSKDERAEVNTWSSRTAASSTSATFIYHYGSFPKNAKMAVRDYFDLLLYFSSYGTKRLILKFPKSIVDYDAVTKFDSSHYRYSSTSLEMWRTANYLLMDFEISPEEGSGWIEEDDYDVSDFISIREDIINGDYSALYVFWMKAAQEGTHDEDYFDEDDDDYYDEDEHDLPKAPPIPPQLKKISGALQDFIDFFEIDEDLVTAAQNMIKSVPSTVKKDYPKLIQQLSEAEKEDYLIRLLNGEVRLDLTLKKHLDGLSGTNVQKQKVISFAELKHKQQIEQEKRVKAEQAKAKRLHEIRMEDLEKSQANHWKSVHFNLNRKTGKSYDLAVETLKELKELAVYKNELAQFNQRMNQIRVDYKRSTSLKRRFDNAGL